MTAAQPDGFALESTLRREFAVREERFDHGAFTASMLLPKAADELIDEDEFDADERLPYWADLWPSARALARHLLDEALPAGPVLELGAGLALPALVLAARGVEVLATDWYPDALRFAAVNASRNGARPLRTRLLDWRSPPAHLPAYPLVLAADVLYEERNADVLAALLPRLTAPSGRVLIADPGRVYRPRFEEQMRAGGWDVLEVDLRREPSPAVGDGVASMIAIVELTRSGG